MKTVSRHAALLLMLLMLPLGMLAQNVRVEPKQPKEEEAPKALEIVERITTESGGNVTIDITPAVLEKIFTPVKNNRGQGNRQGQNSRGKRFTVQVFQNQTSRMAVGEARAQKVRARFPKYRVRTRTSSPNCYVWVGEFSTREEAEKAMDELKRTFREFAGEMRVTTIR